MDYQALKNEIGSRPEFVGLSDNDVAGRLNDTSLLRSVQSRFVSARTIIAEIANGSEILDKLEAVSANISAVKWAMSYLKGESGIDIGHPGTISQIDGLVAGAVLTNEEGEALKNMALLPVSRADVLGLGAVSYNDVNIARAM